MFKSPTEYSHYEAITPSDSTDLSAKGFRGLYTGTGGNITVQPLNGGTAVLFVASAGAVIPITFAKVLATGTAATAIVGLV